MPEGDETIVLQADHIIWTVSSMSVNIAVCVLGWWKCFANNYLHWAAMGTWILLTMQSEWIFSEKQWERNFWLFKTLFYHEIWILRVMVFKIHRISFCMGEELPLFCRFHWKRHRVRKKSRTCLVLPFYHIRFIRYATLASEMVHDSWISVSSRSSHHSYDWDVCSSWWMCNVSSTSSSL